MPLAAHEASVRAGAEGELEPPVKKRRLFEVVFQVLRPPSGASRVVVLEDLHWSDGGSRELLRFLELAEMDDPVARADLLFKLALACWYLGDTGRATRYMREAQAHYEAAGDRRKVSETHRYLSLGAWLAGQVEAAFEHLRAAVLLLEADTPGSELSMAYSSLARLCLWAFRPREGALWGERALELGERLGDAHVQARALMYLGGALVELGEAARGVAAIERGLEAARQTDCHSVSRY